METHLQDRSAAESPQRTAPFAGRASAWASAPAVLFALALALFLAVPARQTQAANAAADGDLVQAVSIRHEIEFGRGVNVTLEADLTDPVLSIIEVRAVFSATGDQNVSSYAYPEFEIGTGASGGGKLTAAFTIDTGVRAYYPPGAEFEVFFELTGSDGSVSATEPERFLYLDPARDWRVLSAPDIPLDFHYYGFSAAAAGRLAERVSTTWRPIASALGLDPDSVGRFRAVIYPNVREFNSVFPPTSAASSDGVFFGGFAMERYGVFVLGGPSAGNVVHELTHLLVNTKVNSPLSPGVPSWLHEGLAQYFEAGSSSGYTSQLRSAAAAGRLLTLRNRNTGPALGSEVGLYYLQVGSFVGELIETRGAGPMAETLRMINEGSSAAEAVQSAYGTELWQLENEWRARLGASELPPPPATPEPSVRPTSTPRAAGMAGSGNSSDAATQSTATAQAEQGGQVPSAGVTAGEGDSPGKDGFNWTGPLIGMAAAAVVFFVWSFRVNRRRFRSKRR